MTLDTRMVSMVLAENANEFITVKFLTKDNEERTYNGRLNVKKYLIVCWPSRLVVVTSLVWVTRSHDTPDVSSSSGLL